MKSNTPRTDAVVNNRAATHGKAVADLDAMMAGTMFTTAPHDALVATVRDCDPAKRAKGGEWEPVSTDTLWKLSFEILNWRNAWPTIRAALSENAAQNRAADKLRAFVRETQPGQCKMLSQGNDCACLLCCIDQLAAPLSPLAEQQETLCARCRGHIVSTEAAPRPDK